MGQVIDHPCRIPDNDSAFRNVLGDDRSCPDEGVASDPDTWQDGHVSSDLGPLLDMRANQLFLDTEGAWVFRVGENHMGT